MIFQNFALFLICLQSFTLMSGKFSIKIFRHIINIEIYKGDVAVNFDLQWMYSIGVNAFNSFTPKFEARNFCFTINRSAIR